MDNKFSVHSQHLLGLLTARNSRMGRITHAPLLKPTFHMRIEMETIMKRTILIIPLITMLFLSAYANRATADTVSTTATPAATLDASCGNTASAEQQLLLGTIKLQGTSLAVTKEQATTLLPLWKQIQTLRPSMAPAQGQGNATAQPTNSNASNQDQITALVNQIQSAMTSDQLTAIAAMKITPQSATTLMQALGITLGGPQQGNTNNAGNGNQPPTGNPPSNGSSMGQSAGAPPSGGQPMGNPPSNGSGAGQSAGTPPSGGQPPSNGQQPASSPACGSMVPPQLIDALVQVLQKTSGVQ